MAILFEDDFASQSVSNTKWGTFKAPSIFGVRNGVLEMIYQPGSFGPGFEIGTLSGPSDDLYIQFDQKFSSNWKWSPVGNKICAPYLNNTTVEGYIFWWVKWGSGLVEANVQHGEDTFYRSTQALPINQWHTIRMRIKRSTVSGTEGIAQMWLDGTQILNVSNINFGWAATANWTHVMLSGYHNGTFINGVETSTITETQYRWVKNFYAFTEAGDVPLTPGAPAPDTTPPAVPQTPTILSTRRIQQWHGKLMFSLRE